MDHHAHHMGHDMGHDMGHNMAHATDSHSMKMGDDGMDDMNMTMIMNMPMFFFFSSEATVLFKEWKCSTVGGLIGSMIGIFFMAALYEGLKYYREYLFWKTYNSLQYRAVTIPDKNMPQEEPHVVQPTMMSKMHFLQTFLHMVQMVVSYFLMLIFMTYNTWLCIAVVVGAGTGYFLFGWKKSVVVDVTEHCH